MNAREAAQAAIHETLGQRDTERTRLIVAAVLDAAEPLLRTEALREAEDAIEDRAADADFTEDPWLITGMRSAGDIVRRMVSNPERGDA